MSVHVGGLLILLFVFFVGAWAGTKWPSSNLIGKVAG